MVGHLSFGISYQLRYRYINPVPNVIFHNIADVFALNNSKLYDYVHCIYLTEPEIKDTTDIAISIPY
jgi:hypothetical protein